MEIMTKSIWQATTGTVTEITENDSGYDWEFNGEQLIWEPAL